MNAEKLIRITLTESEFNEITDSLSESTTRWAINSSKFPEGVQRWGAQSIYKSRSDLHDKFREHYNQILSKGEE